MLRETLLCNRYESASLTHNDKPFTQTQLHKTKSVNFYSPLSNILEAFLVDISNILIAEFAVES